MGSITYGTGAYKRSNGNFPELKLVNMFVEQVKTSEQETAILSRPGLGVLVTNGAGPISGMYSKQGTLNGDVFSISAGNLYRGTTSLGAIAGTGPGSFAGSDTEIIVTRGTVSRSYNGTNIADIVFPGAANVRAVAYVGSLFVYIQDASQKFYWSAVLNGRSVNALNFASAEREPDQLLDVMALGDNIWLFGQSTIESWAHTGDANLPFTRFEQVAFDHGIYGTGCAAEADNALFFIGSNGGVYRIGNVPERVSNHSIEERIIAATTARMFTFEYQGHQFIAVRTNNETMALDVATNEWCEFQSSSSNWIGAYCAMVGRIAYIGHSSTGQLMGWNGWDDLGASMERRFTAVMQADEGQPIHNVRLWANTGATTLSTGLGSAPVVNMRVSRDAGNSWGSYQATDLGALGKNRVAATWRRQGWADFPGIMFDFQVTDPVPFRVSAVKINVPTGGRSRG